jgi:alpha-beta hydrolase superfamily lysophospholipase
MKEYPLNWQSDGIDIRGRGWAPDGPARAVICLVHGLGEHIGRYPHVAAFFVSQAIAVQGIDQRGHGRSGGKRGHAASYQAIYGDIDRLIADAKQRYAGAPCFLYGHSMGGNLVINYALARRPDLTGVISSAPGLRPAFKIPDWKLIVGRLARGVKPDLSMANGLEMEALSRDPQVVAACEKDPLVHDFVSARLGLDIITMGEQALGQAAAFPLPLLLMHGSADRLTSPEASRQFAQTAGDVCTLKIWDGLYHEIHNEPEQGEVFAYALQWLEARSKQVSV